MSRHINVNENSNPVGKTAQTYATMLRTTSNPNAPQQVLNPNDPPYRAHQRAVDSGRLNPNQSNLTGAYHTISSAYGSEPIRLYATRGCSSSNVM